MEKTKEEEFLNIKARKGSPAKAKSPHYSVKL
jgi:hypothetical protein